MLGTQDRARLTWHCRRGMLELDLILQKFMQEQVDHLSAKDLDSFKVLLSCTDPELFAWFMGHEEPQDPALRTIVALIRNQH